MQFLRREWNRDALPFCTLAHRTNGIYFHPSVTNRVSANGAHDIAKFSFRTAAPVDGRQPLFDVNRDSVLELRKGILAPSRNDPIVEIIDVTASRRVRFAFVVVIKFFAAIMIS